MQDASRKKEELKRVERLLHAVACVLPSLRLALVHNGSQVWGAQPGEGIAAVVGYGLAKHLQKISSCVCPATGALTSASDLHAEVTMPLKRPGMATDLGRSSADKLVVAVNRRVIQLKQVEKVTRENFRRACGEEKFPVGFINIQLAGDLLSGIDHNMEPNKQKVVLNHKFKDHCCSIVGGNFVPGRPIERPDSFAREIMGAGGHWG